MNYRIAWAAGLLIALAGAVSAQDISFVEPLPGTVRGTVPVRVDLGPGYQNGFVVFYVGGKAEPLRFKLATVADPTGLFGFDWETQAKDAKVADGEYRVLAIGYNAASEAIGQKAMTVQIQNEVTASSLPARGLLLRYNLTPGREQRYVARSRIRVSGGEGGDYSMFNGAVNAYWNQRVLWRDPEGHARIRNSIFHFSQRNSRGASDDLPGNRGFLSQMMMPSGEKLSQTDQEGVNFPYAEAPIIFPREPVKVGDTWRSPMLINVDPQTVKSDVVIGKHTLTGIEWHGGYRTAVIASTYEGGPYQIEIQGVDTDNAEWLAKCSITLKGNRRTYFAYQPEVGRVLRSEDTSDQTATMEFMEPPVAAMGMEGMMEGSGMMMEGMPAMSGAIPGSGMPGMAGGEAGMGMPAPAEKPAGFDKPGPFRRKGGAAASTTGEVMTGLEGMAEAEPPKVEVSHFQRLIETRIAQEALDVGE